MQPPDLDLTIKPITEDTPLWSQAKEVHAVEQYAGDPSAIPVTCQGQVSCDHCGINTFLLYIKTPDTCDVGRENVPLVAESKAEQITIIHCSIMHF